MRSPILSKYPSAAKSGVALPIVNAARPIMMLLFIFLETPFLVYALVAIGRVLWAVVYMDPFFLSCLWFAMPGWDAIYGN